MTGSAGRVRSIALAASLALGPACAGREVPAPTTCPPTETPAAPVSVAAASASASTSSPPGTEPPDRQAQLWSGVYQAGTVSLLNHPDGIALVPVFSGSQSEGSTVAVLDPAGVPRWQRPLGAVGAASVAVAPDGSIVFLAVDQLSWPRTPEPYERRRIVVIARDGRGQRSFRLPAGASVSSLGVDARGELLMAGRFSGRLVLAGGVSLPGAGAEQSFVARASLEGRASWARVLDGEVDGALPLPDDRVLIVQRFGSGQPATGRLTALDRAGKELWRHDLDAACTGASLRVSKAGLHVVVSPGCLGSPSRPVTDEQPCEMHRLDLATGQVQGHVPVPSCQVEVDENGAVAVLDPFHVAALDSQGKALWIQRLSSSSPCGAYAFTEASLALTPSSFFATASCTGMQQGTTMNSPYARAYGVATTFVGRYARR